MEWIQSKLLTSIQAIRHGFFAPGPEKSLNENLSYKSAPQETVLQARQRACGFLSIPHDHLTHVYQEHGTEIWLVTQDHRGAGAITGENPVGRGDALITSTSQLPLAILIADCLPIFYTTHDARVVGLAHAGWRGTFDDIAVKMVNRMKTEFEVSPTELRVWIGPGISAAGFTVGDDVWNLFLDRWGVNGAGIDRENMNREQVYRDCFNPTQRAIDLKRFNQYRLEATGVLTDNIEVSKECTYSDTRFFSYRRDGKGSGHNMAVIMRD